MSYHREAQYMANMIEIVKADPAKKEDYKRIFDNSALYNHYFKKTDLLDKCLSDALKAGRAFVAVDRNGELRVLRAGLGGLQFNVLRDTAHANPLIHAFLFPPVPN